MQNHIRKSSNNTLASLVCEIKSNLDKTVHFIVKETHRLHNAVTELDIAKLTSCFFKCFITRPLVITMLRYLTLLTSSVDLLIHTKHNLLMSNNVDHIWFSNNIPITFSQGCISISCESTLQGSFACILFISWTCYTWHRSHIDT